MQRIYKCIISDYRPIDYQRLRLLVAISRPLASRKHLSSSLINYVRAQSYTYLIIAASNYRRIFSDPRTPPIIGHTTVFYQARERWYRSNVIFLELNRLWIQQPFESHYWCWRRDGVYIITRVVRLDELSESPGSSPGCPSQVFH